MSAPLLTRLSNGVRVLVEPVSHVQSAAIGLWCRTGSRHETEQEAGITHLIEHMLFKGTPTRTAKQIAEDIEGRGGALNAFTDKEVTCYYCRVLAAEVETGIDVLTDMVLNSLIDPEELEREEQVVVEEIRRSEDEPGDHVHELHLSNRWGNHPLGKPVIGTEASVTSFRRDHLAGYLNRRYRGANVMLSVAGNVNPGRVVEAARQHLDRIPTGGEQPEMEAPRGKPGVSYNAKEVEQVHFCIGTDGCSLYDDDIYTLAVLDGVLGGGMSSRLFQEIRERRGLAYSVGSYSLSYTAGGAFTIYGGTSRKNWDQVQQLVRLELDKVTADGADEGELTRNKLGIEGQLVMGLEGMSGRMMRMSRNELFHERYIPIEETLAKINAVTNHQLIELARRLFAAEGMNTTAIGPA